MEKVISDGIYCAKCDCLIKDEELAEWECGQCDTKNNWEHIEIVIRSKDASNQA
ncbi:hypothetical protein [Neobacillus sp. PS3-40]|uniref:hypothetical protein n=1 Tax=Neobacillus sp. PS3-40 TaxID=3070679 RepID=UPI0027DF7C19|nr:hypothetical protein [Neobacillus sp. PS3-40]WML44070.1 hypothetical protein RCG20_20185 [Neobacillus sp. PS3-40]